MVQPNSEQIIQERSTSHSLQSRVFKVTEKIPGKVLVVEDEVELLEVLEFNLIRQGFEVLVASDGLEACRIIGREKPDLILLDIMLPLLDGWEICRMVRSHQDLRVARTPIIMLSARGSIEDRLKGYDLGADLYLPKPYSVKEVMVKSRQLLTRHHEFLQLSRKLDSLQKWGQLQDQWQQALFHELRNQMTVISGMANHLRDQPNLSQERTGDFAVQISNSSDYLSSLAENYLLVRQVETHPDRLQTEPVILSELFAELSQLFAPLAEQKSSNLELFCPTSLLVDLHKVGLKIVLSTLLDNALKYASHQGRVTLRVTKTDQRIDIMVEDEGPGIPEEEQERIFDKFYRGAQSQHTSSGSGLGLYMARTLAQAMGGHLELLADQRPGCRFLLSLPTGQ